MPERTAPLGLPPRLAAGLALLLLLGACETLPPPYVPPPAAGRVWMPPPRAGVYFEPAPAIQPAMANPDFLKLQGWDQEDALGALAGLRAGCRVARVPDLTAVCQDLARQAPGDAVAARRAVAAGRVCCGPDPRCPTSATPLGPRRGCGV